MYFLFSNYLQKYISLGLIFQKQGSRFLLFKERNFSTPVVSPSFWSFQLHFYVNPELLRPPKHIAFISVALGCRLAPSLFHACEGYILFSSVKLFSLTKTLPVKLYLFWGWDMGHAVGYRLINLKIYERQMPAFSLKKSKTERQNLQLSVPAEGCPDSPVSCWGNFLA